MTIDTTATTTARRPIIEVSGDWLPLREPQDARARSRELAAAAARLLDGDSPVVVHDLGSGTGSMMRWLAPQLPGPQTWTLHDWNAGLLRRAARQVPPRDRDGARVAVRTSREDLAQFGPGGATDPLAGASLVTASALLDVLTSEELHATVGAIVAAHVRALFSLSVTGRVVLSPADPRDALFQQAFNDHQRRQVRTVIGSGTGRAEEDARRMLGPYGVAIARGLFLAAGWHARPADTLWRLRSHDGGHELLADWLDGWLGAAVEQRPELGAEHSDYLHLRMLQLARRQLIATVHHKDLLAWP